MTGDVSMVSMVLTVVAAVMGSAGLFTWLGNRKGNTVGAASDVVALVQTQLDRIDAENKRLHDEKLELLVERGELRTEVGQLRAEVAGMRAQMEAVATVQRRADKAERRARQAGARAEALAAQLRAAGIEPLPHVEMQTGPHVEAAQTVAGTMTFQPDPEEAS